jgi:hypothetical protein
VGGIVADQGVRTDGRGSPLIKGHRPIAGQGIATGIGCRLQGGVGSRADAVVSCCGRTARVARMGSGVGCGLWVLGIRGSEGWDGLWVHMCFHARANGARNP